MKTIEDKDLMAAIYELDRADHEVSAKRSQLHAAEHRREKAIRRLTEIQYIEENWNHEKEAPYGYCPHCGAKGVNRERRIDGNDVCANGHKYPSKNAVQAEGSGGA